VLTVKETAFESLPPHVSLDVSVVVVPSMVLVVVPLSGGLSTRTCNVPACAMLVAGIVAVNWWLLTKLVDREEPLKSTIEVLLKPLPLMVNVNSLPPAVALAGEIEVMDGVDEQLHDTPAASTITSKHKTDDLSAVSIGFPSV
jgi:hypothetical protein